MVRQTSMNGQNGNSAAAGMRHNVANFARDLMSLAELQIQLLAFDARDAGRKSAVPLGLFVVGVIFALSALPVFVFAGGWMLVNRAGFQHDVAFLTSATASLLLGAILCWLGGRQLLHVLEIFARSRDELRENLRWIKSSLGERQPGSMLRDLPQK